MPVLNHISPRGRNTCKHFEFTGAVFTRNGTGRTENRVNGGAGCEDFCRTCRIVVLHDCNTSDKLVPRKDQSFRLRLKIIPDGFFAPFSDREYKHGALPSHFKREIQHSVFDQRTPQFFTMLHGYPDTPLLHHFP